MPNPLPPEATAFLYTVATGEDDIVSDYNELVGGDYFESYASFPEWDGVRINGVLTHAAGRYQFEPATWHSVATALGLIGFTPEEQDQAAWFLAQSDYHRRTGHELFIDLHAGNLARIGSTLQPTWSSLSDATFPTRYKAALANHSV